jgi:hypothetical protein
MSYGDRRVKASALKHAQTTEQTIAAASEVYPIVAYGFVERPSSNGSSSE